MEIDEENNENKGGMWDLEQKLDQPMDEEAGRLRNMYREKKFSTLLLLRLAYQSLGVVYGDLGTSPLYVYNNAFPRGIDDPEDVIGALSLIIYSLTLIPLLKYVFIVCRANDNGQVLSASGGIKVDHPKMSNDVVVVVAVIILVGLFSLQHYGTDRVGWLFAPIVLLWFLLVGGIGIFNIWKYDSSVLRAFSPVYIYRYFRRGKKDGWTSLGGIMLSITGTAVVIVMLVTTLLMTLIMLLVWHCHWVVVLIFTVSSLVIECAYFSAVLFKLDQGGWVPLVIAAAFLLIMYVWHYGTVKRYEFEMHSKVSMAWILGLGPSLGLVRVPGIGLVYTELASGVPHIFSHFITNLPAIHSVVVFVCVKYLPVYTVPEDERFLVKRIGPKNFHMFRCVASLYGQQTQHSRDYNGNSSTANFELSYSSMDSIAPARCHPQGNNTLTSSGHESSQTEVDELEFLNSCRDAGVVHILGNTVIRARRESRFYKKLAIDYIYAFLRKICRENSVIFNVPHESLLNVGQIFYV
ncbi:unnamed protein product [Withania somnifera]